MSRKIQLILLLCMGFSVGNKIHAEENSVNENQVSSADEQSNVPQQVVADEGTQAVYEAEQCKPAPVEKKFKNARKVLKDIAKQHGWSEGYDSNKGRYFVIQEAEFKTADPATDKDFFIKRELAAKKAVLSAKVDIISTVKQEMSAIDLAEMPGSDINKKFGAEKDALDKELAKQKEAIASLLDEVDKQQADRLRGTTFGDRLNDLMAAVIKKLDEGYNASARDEKAKAAYESAKARYETVMRKYAELEEKAEAMKGEVTERQESSVEAMASMPLYGATVISQTESWDKQTGQYQVAVLVCWSKVMERAARAVVTGEDYAIKPSGGAKTITNWLDEQDPSTMIGPRQYLDDKGNRWFLGISARPYDDELSSSQRRKNKGLAEAYAQQMAAFCLFSDVESYKQAKSMMERRENGNMERDTVAEDFAEKLSQGFKNKIIRGMQRLFSDELEHPITGNKIYVVVYGINPNDAKKALEIEKINYATKVMDNRHQTVERGRDAANKAMVKASENRVEDFQEGYQKQAGAISKDLQNREVEKRQKSGGTRIINQGTAPQEMTKKQSTSGTFGGDANVSDDF